MAFGKRKNKEDKIKLTKNSYKQAKNFLAFMRPYMPIYLIGFIFLSFSSSVAVAVPYLLGKVLGMEHIEIPKNWEIGDLDNIYGILSLLALALPAQAVFSFIRIYLFSVVTQNTLRDLRKKAFEQLIKSPISFFDQNKVGELTSRIATDTNLIQDTLTTTIAEFCRQFLIIIVGIIVIFSTSTKLALMMLGVIPVAAISAMIFGKFIKKLSRRTQDEAAKSNSILEEAITGIKSLKAYTNEFFELAKYGKSVNSIKKIALKTAIWRGGFVAFIVTIMFGSIVFIIWQGIELVSIGEIENEEFFQFIMMTVMMGASIGSIPDMFSNIQKAIGATESLMEIINSESEEIDTSIAHENKKFLNGDISLQDIHFSYPSRPEVSVLNGVTINIEAGQQVAIVGSSGSGKSTLASLILQFYTNYSGSILFDYKKANEYELGALRSQMAFVPQEIILLGGTIEENIRYGKPNVSHEEIIEAAKKANALEFIDSFPEGFNTIVGDRGIQLSGGQRQRIAIARAILKDPAILILDEATSALDSESEQAVQEALDRLMEGRTSIVIAHRLSTIKNADTILVLDNGKVVEQGSHDELIKTNQGIYKKLSELQFS